MTGNDDFWSFHTDFLKMSAKIGTFDFSWISRRDQVGFSKMLGPACTLRIRVSASSFQVLTRASGGATALGEKFRF